MIDINASDYHCPKHGQLTEENCMVVTDPKGNAEISCTQCWKVVGEKPAEAPVAVGYDAMHPLLEMTGVLAFGKYSAHYMTHGNRCAVIGYWSEMYSPWSITLGFNREPHFVVDFQPCLWSEPPCPEVLFKPARQHLRQFPELEACLDEKGLVSVMDRRVNSLDRMSEFLYTAIRDWAEANLNQLRKDESCPAK